MHHRLIPGASDHLNTRNRGDAKGNDALLARGFTALPLQGDRFRTTGSPPHTSEPVEGAPPAQVWRPFYLAGNDRPKQHHADNIERDDRGGAQHPKLNFG